MPWYEIVYETGNHSVAFYGSDDEANVALNAHQERARSGETATPQSTERTDIGAIPSSFSCSISVIILPASTQSICMSAHRKRIWMIVARLAINIVENSVNWMMKLYEPLGLYIQRESKAKILPSCSKLAKRRFRTLSTIRHMQTLGRTNALVRDRLRNG